VYKFMRENTPDDWGIKRLQDKILEIAVYVDKLCEENGIEYCLMGGSALGAVRHGGFIPWDDDLDFFMTPDNYEKFVAVFNEKGDKDKFFLEPFGHFDNMVTLGKVRAKNTTYIEESLADYQISHNVYLDIFILHAMEGNTNHLQRLSKRENLKCVTINLYAKKTRLHKYEEVFFKSSCYVYRNCHCLRSVYFYQTKPNKFFKLDFNGFNCFWWKRII